MGKLYRTNTNQKKAGAAVITLGKVNFRVDTITRDTEGYVIGINESTNKKITILSKLFP